MKQSTKKTLVSYAKVFGFGCAVALVGALVIFLFAFFANSLSWLAGFDWARRILYILGSIMLVVGSVGMLFSGDEYYGSKIGFADDDTLGEVKAHTGVAWYTAVIIMGVSVLVVATMTDFLFAAILSL